MYKIFSNNQILRSIESINKDVRTISEKVLISIEPNIKLNSDEKLEDIFLKIFNINSTTYISMLKSLARISSLSQFIYYHLPNIVGLNRISDNPFLISSSPICHTVSNYIKEKDWYTGYPGHQDWFSVRGSKSMLTIWVPIYYTNSVPIHPVGFTDESIKPKSLSKIGKHGYEIDIDKSDYHPCRCPLGSILLFDAFQPHRTVVTEEVKSNQIDLRIAFSVRFEFMDDISFLQKGLSNNYKLTSLKDDDFSKDLMTYTAHDKIAAKLISES
tara:strand:+ start:4823 stop:5635 length:813 start_codon:yes stop_codon:yes gene_type:complete